MITTGTIIKKEEKQIGYYDLLFLDTSLTSLIVRKLPKEWKGTLSDFLNSDTAPECKVTLSFLIKALDKEVSWSMIIWCLDVYKERTNSVPSIPYARLKKTIGLSLSTGLSYSQWIEARRLVEFQMTSAKKSRDDKERLMLEIACGFEPHTTALNSVKFLIKNNLLTYQEVLDKLKALVKIHYL